MSENQNFGSSVLAALLMQKAYERDFNRKPSVYSIKISPLFWSFKFLVGENYPDGTLKACSDFCVEASAEDCWEPRIEEIPLAQDEFGPTPQNWLLRIESEFLQKLGYASIDDSHRVAKVVLDQFAFKQLGASISVQEWEPTVMSLNFGKNQTRVGFSVTPRENLGWWCFMHGKGVTTNSHSDMSEKAICEAFDLLLATAEAKLLKYGCQWCSKGCTTV